MMLGRRIAWPGWQELPIVRDIRCGGREGEVVDLEAKHGVL